MSVLAFWIIVVVGVGLTLRAIASDRRNPPVKKCAGCQGDGIVERHGRNAFCAGCGGAGWVAR